MTDLALLPDVEQLLSAFLRDQDEITAIVGQRVYTELPATKVYPLVRLTRFGGSPVFDRPLYLDRAQLQIDCYGGPKRLANELAETCRAVMAARLPGVYDEAAVTAVGFGALTYLADDTFEPAKPRFLSTISVTLHPLPLVGS